MRHSYIYSVDVRRGFAKMSDSAKLQFLCNELMDKFTPGGSEFYNEPLYCIETALDKIASQENTNRQLVIERNKKAGKPGEVTA